MNLNQDKITEKIETATAIYCKMLEEMCRTRVLADDEVLDASSNVFSYLKIEELSKRWILDEKPIWSLMFDLFVGLFSINIPYSFVIRGEGDMVSLYVGSTEEERETLSRMLIGVFPQLKYKKNNDADSTGKAGDKVYKYQDINGNAALIYGGYLKGNPVGNDRFKNVYQLDGVIKGMMGKKWCLSLFAVPVDRNETVMRQQRWMAKASEYSIFSDLSYSETDGMKTMSYKKNFFHGEQLCKKVESFCQKLTESASCGEWCTSITFSSDTKKSALLLGGLLTSAFYGTESEPEPVHAIYNHEYIRSPLVMGSNYNHCAYCGMEYPKYSTLLSSSELAVYAALPTVDTYGLSVTDYVEFDVNRNVNGNLVLGSIIDSGYLTDNTYRIDANEINRHCLVVGLTGSGKTNTIKSIICGMTKESSRPFMIIEPAKKEYWELYKLGYSNLQIYGVGSNEEKLSSLCLNPFERAVYTDEYGVKKSVPIQTHIDFVYAAFKASFIMYTPMPYVLERSIYEIYEDCGWDIHNNVNKNGDDVYPTIEDLYYKIPEVVTDMGYDNKMRKDLIGSLQARINSMRIGSKGDTLNVYRSYPMEKLLGGNVVVELEDIGDDDVKAFIISILLINLLEYRRQQEDSQCEVRHLMLIEEAHRLLKNIQGGTGESADPRGAAVEFFCNLLAELRSKGQGFIIADQIPSKLAPDLIKNTNLKITHRLVAEEERLLIGGAMHMTEMQKDSISSFKQGVAAVYSEGDNRPKLVKSRYAGEFALPEKANCSRADVLRGTYPNCVNSDGKREYESLTDKRSAVCRACRHRCDKNPRDIITSNGLEVKFDRFSRSLDPLVNNTCKVNNIAGSIKCFINDELDNLTQQEKAHAANCLINCLLESWQLDVRDNTLKEEIERIFIKEYIKIGGLFNA